MKAIYKYSLPVQEKFCDGARIRPYKSERLSLPLRCSNEKSQALAISRYGLRLASRRRTALRHFSPYPLALGETRAFAGTRCIRGRQACRLETRDARHR
jgi:hypothetical protein